MFIVEPMVFSTDGTIAVDFMPQAYQERWVKLELRGKRKNEEKNIQYFGIKTIVRSYGLVQLYSENAGGKRFPKTRWYIGRQEHALHWGLFDEEWQGDHFIDIAPGFKIFLFDAEWGKIGTQRTGYAQYHSTNVHPSIPPYFLKLEKEDSTEKKLVLDKKIGKKLCTHIIRTNWLEWMLMSCSLGQNPHFFVPIPKWSVHSIRSLLPGIQREIEAGWDHGLSDSHDEAQKILDYCTTLSKNNFVPSDAIQQLITMDWHLWPWYSHIHNVLCDVLFQDVTQTLIHEARKNETAE